MLAAGSLTLRAYRGAESGALGRLVAENARHLRPWMPWAPAGTRLTRAVRRDTADYVRDAVAEWEGHRAFSYWLTERATGDVVGHASLRARIGPCALEIGYWVSASRLRRGYATAATRALTTAAFDLPDVRRVEIHCDEANVASAGVPRRLGYRLARIEAKPAEAPGETGRQMVWVADAETWDRASGRGQDPSPASDLAPSPGVTASSSGSTPSSS